ncbi:putative Protein FAM173B [Hypsibius exemplaris]|uniref:Protein FAM173B n=1 Tax=Hypsibius exemplaris TaxID=2072580 RepID=A0A1W0W872_HYPEX|nr:putative Protein FAM173B [Hypsibius exemplaris]
MDKDLEAVLHPNVAAKSHSEVGSSRDSPKTPAARSAPSTLQKSLVIGACVATSTVIGGLLIPFVSPGFRRIALPYVPATDSQVKLVASILTRRTPGSRVVDLGSGDGRLVMAAAQKGFNSTGVEMNWWLVLWSRWRSYSLGLSKLTQFIRQDLYKCDLKSYDVIILFGVSGMMETIKKKLAVEMKSDSLFVACRFPLPSATPLEQLGAGIDSVWVYRKSDVIGGFRSN